MQVCVSRREGVLSISFKSSSPAPIFVVVNFSIICMNANALSVRNVERRITRVVVHGMKRCALFLASFLFGLYIVTSDQS